MNRDKRIITILGICTVMLAIVGGTFAYWMWRSADDQQTAVTFTVDKSFSCSADGGQNLNSTNIKLQPTKDCTNSDYALQRTINVTPDIKRDNLTIKLDMWLTVNSLGTNLSNSDHFMYAITTNPNSCTDGYVSGGNFKGLTTNDKVNLLSEKEYTGTNLEEDTYYLYIWLDEEEKNNNTQNQSFDFSLGGECTDALESGNNNVYQEEILNGAGPVLDPGMIPVTIANDGKVTTISPTDSNWYSYEDKKWANVVLVSDTNRDNYLEKLDQNIEVSSSDILAYYVWIPRYSYAFPNANGSPESISIKFENKGTTKSTGTATGTSYRTHPAFTFGKEELNGLWVGKFETTGSKTMPTILPNLTSLTNINTSTAFAKSLMFAGGTQTGSSVSFEGSTTYGLTENVDSHMMKNSEWGAPVYLAHSVYGVNGTIRLNGYIGTGWPTAKTGCGASSNTDGESETCAMAYGESESYPQSTTGNISGIFDMTGGAQEYVMGVLADSNGNPRTGYVGNYSTKHSGFNGLLSNNTEFISGQLFPSSKYYDLYTTTDPLTACNGEICYGHALSETAGWYSGGTEFLSIDAPWLWRSSDANALNSGGSFAFYSATGAENGETDIGTSIVGATFRSVLLINN